MSQLQEVGDELAATSRYRSRRAPRVIYRRGEIFIAYDERS
jgi:hypothetical protein